MDKDRYIGRLLDNRYEILEVIGTGGMAVVYKARCHRLNRLVAIKILKEDYSQDEEFRRRFHAESQAVAMLSHPNIVSVYDVSTSDDADYIVMELIDGISLKQYMEKKGVLNWKETLHFAIQIAKALDHAHSRGIIHRDIKPHNVMVLKNGSVKVTDFGIARVMSKSNTLTKEALGSVHYISPEQAKGGRVDNRSDIYSLGIVMYEMMTGRPPYDGESPVAVAIQHINGKSQMPSTLNPNIPGGLEQIIMRAMEQEPDHRYPTATAMLYDMDEFRKDPTILFDYNNTSTDMDDAMRIQSAAQEGAAVAVKTTAERVAAKNSETAPKRPAQNQKRQPKPRRRQEEEVVEEEKGGKAATIAVVFCSVVIIIAIAVILVYLLGQGGFDQTQNMVTVPNLINKDVDEASNAAQDYTIVIGHKRYSDKYEAGRIMEQNPGANSQIKKGDTVTVVVSDGPAPEETLMEDLVGLDQEKAMKFLTNTQGIDESLIFIREEYSSEFKAGEVIRTDPVEGATLTDGQSISLWISLGPSVESKTMPYVVGQEVELAKKVLDNAGFKNVVVEEVESSLSQGHVINQSVPNGEYIPVTTPIILQIPVWENTHVTQPPAETDDPEDYVAKVVDIELPGVITEECVLSVYRDGVLVEERDIPAGTVSAEFTLTGKGIMEFTVITDSNVSWTIEVNFDE